MIFKRCGTCKHNCRSVSITTSVDLAIDTGSSPGTHTYGGTCDKYNKHYKGESRTCDDLAEEYKKLYGGSPRTMPMEAVYNILANRTDLFYVDEEEGTIHRRR